MMDLALPKKQQVLKDVSFMLSYLGFLFIAIGTILILIPALPWVYYHINVQATSDEAENLSGFILPSKTGTGTASPTPLPIPVKKPIYKLPTFDPTLPSQDMLIIPKIGVKAVIHEGEDSVKALYKGVWRVPDFGTPIKNEYPVIFAAHRFGYIEWSSTFRRTSSFANLPNLKAGDTFTIIWGQRSFLYKIYKMEENTKLTDYDADVILYTCKYLKSDVRIVAYARRVELFE